MPFIRAVFIDAILHNYFSKEITLMELNFTEIEKLNGQIVNIAYKYKNDAPYNEFVLNAIKAIERLY